MRLPPLLLILTILLAAAAQAFAAGPVPIVAAENFYGDLAQQIGGADVRVTSILSNPDQDPHLFEASPSVARAIAGARIVIYSGIGYDPWIETLLKAAHPGGERATIDVAALAGKKTGDNPHIWYDPAIMLKAAAALAEDLADADPAHRADFAARRAEFERSLEPVMAKIAALESRLAGKQATATEPIFGYMFDALGMKVVNQSFQRAVMNNTEPAASDVAAFETSLKTHQVELLVYNSQASDPIALRMVGIAKASHVPVVGATETEPPGKTYQAWMMSELEAVDRALAK
jgi:zinc/manganese transport system substrate-binding protein